MGGLKPTHKLVYKILIKTYHAKFGKSVFSTIKNINVGIQIYNSILAIK